MMSGRLTVAVFVFATLFAAPAVHPQTWPERPVKLVVPFGAGGNSDIVARLIAARFGDVFGQQFIVENRPGAAGVIGAEFVARAPADGYTLLIATQPQIAIVPTMSRTSYDPVKDLVPISNIGTNPFVLVIQPGLPVSTLAEFLDYARGHPGKLTYAVTGFASVNHLTMMLLAKHAGVDMVPVVYKGGPAALTDVVGGRVDAYLPAPSVVTPHADGKDLRLLAVTGERRMPQLAKIPTLVESGFPDLKIVLWTGLFAPAGTPRAIVERMSRETARVVREPGLAKRLADDGVDPLGNTPDEFAASIAQDIVFWREAIRTTGIRER
jgi:tripartite-type tricarboxylate transporter receptor subunit TctC